MIKKLLCLLLCLPGALWAACPTGSTCISISGLPAGSAISGSNLAICDQAGVTNACTYLQVEAYVSSVLLPLSLSSLVTQAANTIVANATGSAAAPTAITVSSATLSDLQATTTFTVAGTGCTPTGPTGGPFGGQFTLAAGPCTSVTITFNGATGFTAPHGYDCSADDLTQQNAGVWIPEWGQKSTTTTTAVIPIPTAAAATDVISFHCEWN